MAIINSTEFTSFNDEIQDALYVLAANVRAAECLIAYHERSEFEFNGLAWNCHAHKCTFSRIFCRSLSGKLR